MRKNMRMNGKYKKRGICMLLVFSLYVLCACAADHQTEEKQKEIQVSGAVKMTDSEKADWLWNQKYNTTEQCIYDFSFDEGVDPEYTWEESSIIQRDKQGKVLSTHSIQDEVGYGDGARILQVSQKYLCFAVESDMDDVYIIYIAPIEEQDGKEQILWEQQEKISETNELRAYISESFLYYAKEKALYRYHLESKETEKILEGKQSIHLFSAAADNFLYVYDGLYGYDEKYDDVEMRCDCLYRIDIKNGTSEQIYTAKEGELSEILAVSDNLLYIRQRNQQDDSVSIACYDSKKQETKSVIQEKQLRQFLESEQLIHPEEKIDSVDLEDIFFGEDCIYFHIHNYYDYKNEDSKNIDGSVVVKAPLDDLSKLSNETVLNQWLYEHVDDWLEEGFTLCGDEMLLYFSDSHGEESGTCMAGYDINHQTIRDIPETNPLYQRFPLLLTDVEDLGRVCE